MHGKRNGTQRAAWFGVIAPWCAFAIGCESSSVSVGPRGGYADVAARLERVIAHEMADKRLPALSIALVDRQQVVWARGFGMADPDAETPATAHTVYRVGSVSKLFTDVGIMQLVERGELDLDAPVQRYLPDFQPKNPHDKPITLRQLMAHRSGLVREPPVGHYFDDTEPSLAATVASLNDTTLIYAPEARAKYSNAGIGVVGYVLEHTQGEPFTQYLKHAVLDPLGMDASAFEPTPAVREKLAKAYMWTYDGREFEAPDFQFGMAPAASLYASVIDLSKFLRVLFAGGKSPGGQVLRPETLEAMWKPQFAAPAQTTGFGLGFSIGELDSQRTIGHGGAVYGFATQLLAMPDAKLGVAAVTTMDFANTVTRRISQHALRLLLARREGRPLPDWHFTQPVDPSLARRLAGRYEGGGRTIELTARDGGLSMLDRGVQVAVRRLDDRLVGDDRIRYGPEIQLTDGDALVVDATIMRRVPDRKPPPAPAKWRGLIGEYGWDFDTLYVLERDGKLHVLIEWFLYYPLEETSENVFQFPAYGLYPGAQLVFTRDANGRATQASLNGLVFKRRTVGTAAGETFRITPVKPIDELRRAALGARRPHEADPKREPDLVELTSLDPTIRLDIRYASTNNFMSTVFYPQARAFLQRPAADALVRAHQALAEHGYGLLIHDAYRPWYVTKMFWDATPEDKRDFVANPDDGSRHNRGCAVDLTLYDLETGRPVEMVSGYDEFTERAYPAYPGGTSAQRWHRELLRRAMEAQDFSVYKFEWWHFDYQAWKEYAILNRTFEQIASRQGK